MPLPAYLAKRPHRLCPGCGRSFRVASEKSKKAWCTEACRTAFKRRQPDAHDRGFDYCAPCGVWALALHRRRGGQPIPCSACGRPSKRITEEAWMALLIR